MRFLLDTTAASQIGRSGAPAPVLAWLAAVAEDDLALSVLSLGEMRLGIERLRRRDPAAARALEARIQALARALAGRIIDVSAEVADRWARLAGAADPLPVVDGLIAATALAHGLVVVTRNVTDFERCGARVLNPWDRGRLGEGIRCAE